MKREKADNIHEATQDGEVDDVEGYALIVQGIAEMFLLWRMIPDGFTSVGVAVKILLLGMTIYSAVNTYSTRMKLIPPLSENADNLSWNSSSRPR